MKKLRLDILDAYKAYRKETSYTLEGDLIVYLG